MIPKIVHYCWFGGAKKPKKVLKCIKNWKDKLPEYDFIEWNESNFPFGDIQYTADAYREKKYAFVSDVARLYALKNYGGIYFDTDIEVCRDFAHILDTNLVVSYESTSRIMTGFFAAEKNNIYIDMLLEKYATLSFYDREGKYNLTPNTVYFTDLLSNFGISYDSVGSCINGIAVYDYHTFGCYNADLSVYEKTDETYIIHHCAASWMPKRVKYEMILKRIAAKVLGKNAYQKLKVAFKKNN